MEEENNSVDINYQKGFNHGYWLSADDGKHYLDEILHGMKNKESSYYTGLLAGQKQREKQKFIDQFKNKSASKDHSIDKDE